MEGCGESGERREDSRVLGYESEYEGVYEHGVHRLFTRGCG